MAETDEQDNLRRSLAQRASELITPHTDITVVRQALDVACNLRRDVDLSRLLMGTLRAIDTEQQTYQSRHKGEKRKDLTIAAKATITAYWLGDLMYLSSDDFEAGVEAVQDSIASFQRAVA